MSRSEVFFALGDETRLRLVERLVARPHQSITELTEGTAITRQAVTKHLRVLQGAGLVTPQKHGRETRYLFLVDKLDEARSFLDAMSRRWDKQLDRLNTLVE